MDLLEFVFLKKTTSWPKAFKISVYHLICGACHAF